MEGRPTAGEFLVLGTLEVLLNQAIALHADGGRLLSSLSGKVIRVRAWAPDFIFYCLIDADGIQLSTEYDGDAHIRLRGSAGSLLYRAMMPRGSDENSAASVDDELVIDGEPEAVTLLREALDTFNLWEALRTWVREHLAMPEILGLLRQHDPAWLERLQNVPQLMSEIVEELRQQRQMQLQLMEEVRSLRESLQSERRTDIVCITAGVLLLALALLTVSGQFTLSGAVGADTRNQALLLAALGTALMLFRMFGKRYRS